MILIVCSSQDWHGRIVRQHLETRGQRVFVADPLELGHGADIAYSPEDPGRTEWRRADGERVRLGEVKAVWFRKWYSANAPRRVTEPAERDFIQREWGEVVRSMFLTIAAPFVNDPVATAYATKPLQLALARRAGLNVPATLITSSAARALEFVRTHPGGVVHKTLKPHFQRVLATKAWEEDDARHLDDLELAPTIFQAQVAGQRELRITVVGGRVFAAEHETTFVDGRTDFSAVYRPHNLPAEVRHGLLCLMRSLGLVFGAVDMKIDARGDYHFLEVNPQGQYLWIEIETGMALSEAMADLLCDLASSNSGHTTLGSPLESHGGADRWTGHERSRVFSQREALLNRV